MTQKIIEESAKEMIKHPGSGSCKFQTVNQRLVYSIHQEMSSDPIPHTLKGMCNLWTEKAKIVLGSRNQNLRVFPPK